MHIITIPGIYGSGAGHWQTLWEQKNPSWVRFRPSDWDRPDLEDWIKALDREVAASAQPPVLLAHSLGCLLVAHWASRTNRLVRGALLVSVPDPKGPNFPSDAASFSDVPHRPLPFPALIVSSANDPYGTQAYARQRADQWKTRFIAIGPYGHINESSGVGEWEYGQGVLDAFIAGLPA